MKCVWKGTIAASVLLILISSASPQQVSPSLQLNEKEYFEMPGLNVMSFQDIYPEGHQAGVSIILNGVRIAISNTNEVKNPVNVLQPIRSATI